MFDAILAFFGLVTRRRYEDDLAQAAHRIGELQDRINGLSKGTAALERQAHTDSRNIEKLHRKIDYLTKHRDRLANSLDIVRQVLDESGVPCKHEVEAKDVSPDEVAGDDHRY